MGLGYVAAKIGKGLVAGFVGTLAITASQTVEMKLKDRPPSSAPAEAASKVLGVAPTGDAEKQRFSQFVHFGYGTGWGAFRGLLAALGLKGIPATLTLFASIYGAALLMLPCLKVAPPVSEWGGEAIAVDAWHHLVYAAATSAAFERLDEEKA